MVFCLPLGASAKGGYNKQMKKEILIILTIFLVIFVVFWNKTSQNPENIKKILKINDVLVNIDVVSTDSEREKGLSGRLSLAENEGMLFVFEEEGYYGIWMKDMNFPIDIAWLNQDKKIIYIESNVGPETFPKGFYAERDGLSLLSLYVLETKAGFFENAKIKIGDSAEF